MKKILIVLAVLIVVVGVVYFGHDVRKEMHLIVKNPDGTETRIRIEPPAETEDPEWIREREAIVDEWMRRDDERDARRAVPAP